VTPPAQRFVILCLARTGSSHLVDLLDSHPDVRCYGEVLNATHRGAAGEGWIGEARDGIAAGAHVDALLVGTDGVSAAGFKLPSNSLADRPEIREWLDAAPDVAVIRLRRANSLALLVSRRLLGATLVSQSIYGSYGDAAIEIAPTAAVRALERIEAEDAELDEIAAGHPTVGLDYERLGAEDEPARAFELLGVAPPSPGSLSSRYERLRTRPFSDVISNWTELRAALAETRFAPMLVEDDAG
jgi:hypothetical protein